MTLLLSLLAPPSHAADTRVDQMAARHLAMWSDADRRAAEVAPMRAMNPEWDFMGRTFLALSLASMALDEPSREAELLPVIDTIIADTIAVEASEGVYAWLLPYGRSGAWQDTSQRSLFVDGEVALMIGARRLVEDDGRWDAEHTRRIDASVGLIARSPSLMGESYPDETWMFCNTVALAAIAAYDVLEPEADHSALIDRWTETAKQTMVEPTTGLLVSSTTHDGRWKDGPEGSTIWLASHMLQFFAPELAQDQYTRARASLGRTLLGLGYALEWPPALGADYVDVDAGEIVPGLGASTSSSGLAIVAARSFRDDAYHAALVRSLDWTAQPITEGGELRYGRSNPVGDAVILYGLVEGPLRAELTARSSAPAPQTPPRAPAPE